MEKIMSTEDKIRRAEEIYNRKKIEQEKSQMTKVKVNSKKDIKFVKKIIIQIIICFVIYSVFYLIKNNDYIFSEDFVEKSKQILSYDINFQKIYNDIKEEIITKEVFSQDENTITEETINDTNKEENNIEKKEINQETDEFSQMEKDAISIKNTINFINPIEGTVTSEFGWRNPTTDTVPKFHTGIDISSPSGTIIYSSTDGKVIVASSTGDYR